MTDDCGRQRIDPHDGPLLSKHVLIVDDGELLRRSLSFHLEQAGYWAKHADFLLCDRLTGRPRLIIELDDSSHKQRRRRERDAFLDLLCASAGLPILHQPVRMAYDTKDLRQSIIDTITDPKTDPKDS